MALTDQPYLPLYVDDWMNNTKLKLCSPGAHGLMVSIMCLMHKSESYGIILLKQKFKQSDNQKLNFAKQIAKLSSFDLLEIELNFYELLDEGVLKIDGENLICSRMIKDATISKNRSLSGKKGGRNTQINIKDFALAKVKANTGIETVNENEDESVNTNDIEISKTKKTFKIPTVSEIKEYCSERNNTVDANKFFNFYESKGWMVGKSKMKDWKACVRTWEGNSTEKQKTESGDLIHTN